jgi:hypothetical protein
LYSRTEYWVSNGGEPIRGPFPEPEPCKPTLERSRDCECEGEGECEGYKEFVSLFSFSIDRLKRAFLSDLK